jgi:hypothetical protein
VIEIPSAALPYLLSGGSTAITLGLAFVVYRGVRGLRDRILKCDASIQAEASQLTNAINELRRSFAHLEKEGLRETENVEPGIAGLSDMARTKILKMHRMGHAPSHIADTLRLPKGEVQLFIKVHRIVMEPYQGAGVLAGQGGPKKD